VATRTDFTDQEWESLQKGVTGTGLLISLSDRSFFDTFKEAGSLAKHLAQAKQSSSSGLVCELADRHGTGFGLVSSPDTVEREALEALRSAKSTLESKAPDELDAYREFVIEIARSFLRVHSLSLSRTWRAHRFGAGKGSGRGARRLLPSAGATGAGAG
jgi:hypothetical protein